MRAPAVATLLLAALGAAALGAVAPVSRAAVTRPVVAGRLVVGLDTAGGAAAAQRLRDDPTLRVVRVIAPLHAMVVATAAGREAAARSRLAAAPGVRFVERDPVAALDHADCTANPACLMPNDPLLRAQWYLQNDRSTVPPPGATSVAANDVDAPLGWARSLGTAAVDIAVVDTGIDAGHPDLAGRVVAAATVSTNADVTDHVGHGTFVAGIIGAGWNNAIGIAGTDPGARLVNVKAADDAGPNPEDLSASAIAGGITYAVDHGARVINVSAGSATESTLIDEAVAYADAHGALVVASAGNDGTDTRVFPAASPGAIAVGATTAGGQRAAFSNWGSWVQLAAPGDGIVSTVPTYATARFAAPDPSSPYAYRSGTSFSAPIVSAIAAMVWPLVSDANGDGRVNDDVAARLFATAEPTGGAGTDTRYGTVSLCRAVAAPDFAACTPPPPSAPTAVAPPPPPAVAPVVATPKPIRRILPLRPGRRSGTLTGSRRRVSITVAPGGRAVSRLTATLALRCAGGRRRVVAVAVLGAKDTAPLRADGTLTLTAVQRLRGRGSLRVRATVTFSVSGSATGTLGVTGRGRGLRGCRSGTLRWRVS